MSDDTGRPVYSISRSLSPSYNSEHVQQPTQTVDHTPPQPVIIVHDASKNILGPHPCMITCPFCHTKGFSFVEYNSTSKTHCFAFLFFITTCLCCIPYMFKTFKGVNHYCEKCGGYLGIYDK